MRRQLVRFLSSLIPGPFVRVAYNRLVHPKRYAFREGELELLKSAHQDELLFNGAVMKRYRWGQGRHSVLLVHGWEGSAANFSGLIPTLLQNDCTIHAFDGPSHGLSAETENPLFDFPQLLIEILEGLEPDFVISHSFGSVSAAYALAESNSFLPAGCILLTTPDRFVDRVREISDDLGVAPAVARGLIKKVEADLNIDAQGLRVSEFVRRIEKTKGLIIHDVNDRVIPSKHSVTVHENWPGSELKLVEGTGHFRILRSGEVAMIIRKFMDENAPVTGTTNNNLS